MFCCAHLKHLINSSPLIHLHVVRFLVSKWFVLPSLIQKRECPSKWFLFILHFWPSVCFSICRSWNYYFSIEIVKFLLAVLTSTVPSVDSVRHPFYVPTVGQLPILCLPPFSGHERMDEWTKKVRLVECVWITNLFPRLFSVPSPPHLSMSISRGRTDRQLPGETLLGTKCAKNSHQVPV